MDLKGIRILFGVAALLIIVGGGNMLIGSSKANDYLRLLSGAPPSAASELSQPQNSPQNNEIIDRRILSRIEFYQFVELGGRGMLLLGCGCLLFALISKHRLRQRELLD